MQKTEFKPVVHKRISESIFEQIEEMILAGKLSPGERLPSERTLMQLYKRSHPTIREALRMLESAGYIEVIPGDGAMIRQSDVNPVGKPLSEFLRFKKASFREVCEFLQQAEPAFARICAAKRTWEDIIDLESCLSDFGKRLNSAQGFYESFFAFHKRLIKATHNPLAIVSLEAIYEVIDPPDFAAQAFAASAKKTRDFMEEYRIHSELFTALQNKDGQKSAQLSGKCWEQWSFPSGNGGGV